MEGESGRDKRRRDRRGGVGGGEEGRVLGVGARVGRNMRPTDLLQIVLVIFNDLQAH